MEMIFCPNCNRLTGYKRVIGFGAFFAVLLTAGFWLLTLPFYPKRCITCGFTKSDSVPWNRTWKMGALIVAGFLFIRILGSAIEDALKSKPTPIVDGLDYNKPVSRAVQPALPSSAASERQNFREDGRTYSVAIIVATDIPFDADVFAQGKIARFGYADGMRSRPFAVLEDEDQSSKTLLCAMKEDEGREVLSFYHVGEVVRIYGKSMGTGMAILTDCKVASPQSNVVRLTLNAQDYKSANLGAQPPPVVPDTEQSTEVSLASQETTAPIAVSAPDPEYSQEAREKKISGVCVLSLTVETDGSVSNIAVTQPLGSGLDEKAVETIRKWKFKPAMKDGKPVARMIAIQMNFHID